MTKRNLSAPQRIHLAWTAYQRRGIYGAITDLALSYGVSRWLVYHLMQMLIPLMLQLANPKSPGPQPQTQEIRVDKRHIDRAIITLRVVGNVSLKADRSSLSSTEGIQRCLFEALETYRSIGYISQVITRAQQQATAFREHLVYEASGTGLLDELFAGDTPLLVVVEPRSTALLLLMCEEHRDSDTWGIHLLQTQQQGFQFNRIGSDKSQGIICGVQAALGQEIPHQIDICLCLVLVNATINRGFDEYNAQNIGHLFAKVAKVDAALERSAYKSIRIAYERFSVLDSAKSECVIQKRIQAWEKAQQAMTHAIDLYEAFHYLAEELYALFTPVSIEGIPRTFLAVQADLEAVIALLFELPSVLVQEVRTSLVSQQEGLFVFWYQWEAYLSQLRQAIDDDGLLQILLLEYFLLRRKLSHPQAQQALAEAENFLDVYLGQQAASIREHVASVLDGLVRSTALVENANSRVRPYLNTRKGVSQGFLDLIWLYQNTRTYRRGKRKGHSPFELLGVSLPEDWLTLIGMPRD